MRFISYKQLDSVDCGPTCLKMIFRYYGKNIEVSQIRKFVQLGREGANLLGLKDTADLYGMRTEASQLSIDVLADHAKLPALLHWKQNHFVVLYKVRNDKFFIADPAVGKLKLDVDAFAKAWTGGSHDQNRFGYALLMEPTGEFYKVKSFNSSDEGSSRPWRDIFRTVLPYQKAILQLILGVGILSAIQLVLPFLMKTLVDVGLGNKDLTILNLVILGQVVVTVSRFAIEVLRGWILLYLSNSINLSILVRFFGKLFRLPITFYDTKNTGDLLQRISDQQRIEQFLTGSSLSSLMSLISLLLLLIVLLKYSITVFLVFVITSLFYAAWIVYFLRRRRTIDYHRFDLLGQEQAVNIQIIQGMQEIKLYGMENRMFSIWKSVQSQLFDIRSRNMRINQWQQAGSVLINEGRNILVLFVSALSVIKGYMSIGEMMAIQFIVGELMGPVEQMVGFSQSWQNAKLSYLRMQEVNSIAEEDVTISEADQEKSELAIASWQDFRRAKTLNNGTLDFSKKLLSISIMSNGEGVSAVQENEKPKGNTIHQAKIEDFDRVIEFRNVSFKYPGAGNELILDGLNFTIPLYRTTAIVGSSGSGKTTLLKLLLKYYEPTEGTILVGNVDLNTFKHSRWRSLCATVMQESILFSETILTNIASGDENPEIDRIKMCAKLACIDEFITSLPQNYLTRIGSGGLTISMGQKQRILLARCLYKDSPFLFLDEATNSLDARNESNIVSNIANHSGGKTIVVVAHRMSTVRNASKILVMKDGDIIESGSHEELLLHKGEYFQLLSSQLLKD